METEFLMESTIRGHNVYKYIWSSVVGEELECQIETGNVHDLYAVSVVKGILNSFFLKYVLLYVLKECTVLCVFTKL